MSLPGFFPPERGPDTAASSNITTTVSQSVHQTAGAAAIAVGVVTALLILWWGWREWRRKGRCQLLLLWFVGTLGYLTDPDFQVLADIPAPPVGGWSPGIFTEFGIREPLWNVTVFGMWTCIPAYLCFTALCDRWPRRTFWLLFGALALADTVLEIPGILGQLWIYSGDQPFHFYPLPPLVWPLSFMTVGLIMGAVLYAFNGRITGWQWWLTVPVLASDYLTFPFLLTWPTIVGLHTGVGEPWTSLLGLATLATELTAVYLISVFLPAQPEPRRTAAPAAETSSPRAKTAAPSHRLAQP